MLALLPGRANRRRFAADRDIFLGGRFLSIGGSSSMSRDTRIGIKHQGFEVSRSESYFLRFVREIRQIRHYYAVLFSCLILLKCDSGTYPQNAIITVNLLRLGNMIP